MEHLTHAFLDTYPPTYDATHSYDEAIESIVAMLRDYSKCDIKFEHDNKIYRFTSSYTNIRILSPIDSKISEYVQTLPKTPTQAIDHGLDYCCLLVADVEITFGKVADKARIQDGIDSIDTGNVNIDLLNFPDTTNNTQKIENCYIVKIPLAVGSKYCTLHDISDYSKCINCELNKELNGLFVIGGSIRYIMGSFVNADNNPSCVLNNYEEQISRCETRYTNGVRYENSYYIVGSCVSQKYQHNAEFNKPTLCKDYIFSLQLNDSRMIVSNDNLNTTRLFNAVPIKIMFTACGCTSDEEMMKYIDPDGENIELYTSVMEACLYGYKHRQIYNKIGVPLNPNVSYIQPLTPLTELEAKYIIGQIILNDRTKQQFITDNGVGYKQKVIMTVTDILNKRFMNGINSDKEAVLTEMGMIVRKLFNVANRFEQEDSKTSWVNRRILFGKQLTREFKRISDGKNRMIERKAKEIVQNISTTDAIFKSLIDKMKGFYISITEEISNNLSISFKAIDQERTRLATERLEPKSLIFIWGKLREINIASNKKAESYLTVEHRMVSPSQEFFLCPAQTPEGGKSVGKFVAPTVTSFFSTWKDPTPIKQYLDTCKVIVKKCPKLSEYYIIRLNGCIVGYVKQLDDAEQLYKDLYIQRRTGFKQPVMETAIHNWKELESSAYDVSIIKDDWKMYIDIWTDDGRMMAPFIPTQYVDEMLNLKSPPNFYELIRDGKIEVLCPKSIEYQFVIAPTYKDYYANPSRYTHVALLGGLNAICGAINPAFSMCKTVRAAYITNHIKQAISCTHMYPQITKYDIINNLLSAEVPICRSSMFDLLQLHKAPHGQNLVIAFMHMEDNQEDSLIINRESVDKGMLLIDVLQRIDARTEGSEAQFGTDQKYMTKCNPTSYLTIDSKTGLHKKIGTYINFNDVILAMYVKYVGDKYIDESIQNKLSDCKSDEIDKRRRVIVDSEFNTNNTHVKSFMIGQYRTLENGDKITSEHGQKGIIGAIYPPDKIPFTDEGIRPDIIFSHESVFKRETLGHLYAAIMGKIAALYCCPIESTSFYNESSPYRIQEMLNGIGVEEHGYETMYNPDTGLKLKNQVFLANLYYTRQRHMTELKASTRNGGMRDPINGQPVGGRNKGSAVSIDRMTNESIAASGAMNVKFDNMLEQGAKAKIGICKVCNNINCYYSQKDKQWVCPQCGVHCEIQQQIVSPATALINGVLNSIGVNIKADIKK